MIVINETGEIVAFSAAAEKLFGYSVAHVTGKNVRMLMTETDRAHHDQYIANYLDTGEEQIIGIGRVVEAKLANGDKIPVELKIGEAKVGDQRLFTGYIRDVSERQAAEHRISIMQAELYNFSRLSAVGTMASAMAHELTQPLTAVSNYLEAARDLLDTPTEEVISMVKEALGAASAQSVRAGQIVRRLRDYVSRGEIDTRPVDIGPLIRDAASLSKLGMEGPLPRIIVRIEADLPMAHADRLQIRQVIVNLVKNAIEATSNIASPQIWITASRRDELHLQVDVRDNGPGLAEHPDHTPFDPFHSSKPNGMGLGLSICQTIVDAHGGSIWVEANQPCGAAFCFTLKTVETGQDA
ncbi:sensory box sensor histidine kinase FixL [Hyphomonas johnsonii MHS-2]|uniref:Sensor protein FixL n=2 Tax=Hyphomonas johnsonii TaxID=81031 RepID=A0A059FS94_9PROT|nr:sensory box sensor histidine kinase FixL [Hyphomonas johnsonii MHS-2]